MNKLTQTVIVKYETDILFKGIQGVETFAEDNIIYVRPKWICVDGAMPDEGVYILGCSGEGSPVYITRLINGEWDTGANGKRPCYLGKTMEKTSAPVVYWMPIPESPT